MKLNGNHIICSKQPNGKVMHVFEVWHSASGGKKDDYKTRGFVEVECPNYNSMEVESQWLKDNKPTSGIYTTSPISTSITSRFHSNWKLVLELPDFLAI
jgi:hypothetical protein